MTTMLCHLGDRLGLFKDLAANGAATSAELAQRTGITERYAREWLGGLGAAGYLASDPASQRYTLPPEHALALAQEGGPMFVGGMLQMLPAQPGQMDALAEAFRLGGGVPQSAYGEHFWYGFERFSGTWFENSLLQLWLPCLPDVEAKLAAGAVVADVGCGRGRALIKMAQAFPASRFVGFDAYAPTIELAAQRAESAGVGDHVRCIEHDVVLGLPEQYDLITSFDVIHDMANPRGALKAIRPALKPDGSYVCLEINAEDRREDNVGPLAALFYGASITYCMTTSLANQGEGLGTLGMPNGSSENFARRRFSAVSGESPLIVRSTACTRLRPSDRRSAPHARFPNCVAGSVHLLADRAFAGPQSPSTAGDAALDRYGERACGFR